MINLIKCLKSAKHFVTCTQCGHVFDLNSVVESGMGYVNCPKCGEAITQ